MGTSGHRRLAHDWWSRSPDYHMILTYDVYVECVGLFPIGRITGLRLLSKLPSAMKLSGFVDVSEVT